MASEDRRSFLKNVAVTGAYFAFSGNTKDTANKLIPYVIPPENIRPGTWVHIATTCRECPAGCGMYVRHRDGRIVKCEGNPDHPINMGGLCPRGQSAPQGLYDPDRIKVPLIKNNNEFQAVSWDGAFSKIGKVLSEKNSSVAIISDLQTGALSEVTNSFLSLFGSSRLLTYEPINYEPLRNAHQKLFGIEQIPRYNIADCDSLISFGADFLETWVSPVEYAYQFSKFRSPQGIPAGKENYYYAGPRLSMSAANADNFLMIEPQRMQWFALAIVKMMLELNLVRTDSAVVKEITDKLAGSEAFEKSGVQIGTIEKIAKRFAGSKRSIAIASPVFARNSKAAQNISLIAALLNYAVGNVNEGIDFSRVHAFGHVEVEKKTEKFLEEITSNDILFIHNTNIAFTRPDAIKHLKRAKKIIYCSILPDETAQISDWVLPIDSPLETWGDYEPYTGIHSIMQPTMARVVDSRMTGDIYIALSQVLKRESIFGNNKNFKDVLQNRWQQIYERNDTGLSFTEFWTSVLRQGHFVEPVVQKTATVQSFGLQKLTEKPSSQKTIRLFIWPSIMLYDGRTANRGWIQESPEPVSYAAWSCWVDVHSKTAKSFGIRDGEVVSIYNDNSSIDLPVRITDETDPQCVSIIVGQGHHATGLSIANGIGENVFELVKYDEDDMFGDVSIKHTGKKENIVYTSATRLQYGRNILKTLSSRDFLSNSFKREQIIYPLQEGYSPKRDLYPGHAHKKHRWAMIVDLHKCIGCGACGVACYAENNIVVMGQKQVNNGREMAWLKVVPYFLDKKEKIAWLPMLCQHCDAAPCEPVCPVYAAVHNEEGLNAQIYNRCVGTRYCSNNCPYKVRRFNWFNSKWQKSLQLQLNPEVTVRCRGVMEKCTFCVQRIREVEYLALREHRKIKDGEIKPACVQSCPTKVYTFGDLLDTKSQVTKIIQCNPRAYQVLKELNTKPAVIYLKKVINDEDFFSTVNA